MKEFVKNIDARTIRETGLFLALAGALFIIFQIATNDISRLEGTMQTHNQTNAEINRETNEILRELSTVIEGNTKVLEFINRK